MNTRNTYVVLRTDQISPIMLNRMSSLANAVTQKGEHEKVMYIKNVSTDQVIEIKAVKDPRTGEVVYVNLPAEVEVNIYHYKQEERWNNFRDVMMCLLTLHATINGTITGDTSNSMLNASTDTELPSTDDYEQMLTDFATFNTNDPSDKYDISS